MGSGPASPARPDPARPKSETQLALSGYCPVSLISDRRLVQGQSEYTVQHEGRAYRFASALMSNLFRKDPDRYIPVNRGDCPVSQVERGVLAARQTQGGACSTRAGCLLCASEDARQAPVPEGTRSDTPRSTTWLSRVLPALPGTGAARARRPEVRGHARWPPILVPRPQSSRRLPDRRELRSGDDPSLNGPEIRIDLSRRPGISRHCIGRRKTPLDAAAENLYPGNRPMPGWNGNGLRPR